MPAVAYLLKSPLDCTTASGQKSLCNIATVHCHLQLFYITRSSEQRLAVTLDDSTSAAANAGSETRIDLSGLPGTGYEIPEFT